MRVSWAAGGGGGAVLGIAAVRRLWGRVDLRRPGGAHATYPLPPPFEIAALIAAIVNGVDTGAEDFWGVEGSSDNTPLERDLREIAIAKWHGKVEVVGRGRKRGETKGE